jgi:hypothetical protein
VDVCGIDIAEDVLEYRLGLMLAQRAGGDVLVGLAITNQVQKLGRAPAGIRPE